MRINLQGVGKKFNLNFKKREGILARLLSVFSLSKNTNDFWVFRGIDFTPADGQIVGIIGRNGSGKSTLLRVLAGIYQADEGTVKLKGQVAYLTGFGQGLMPKLTMRENIYLVGSLLGLGQKEIKQRFAEIVEFSELGEYIETPVYKFSSGMVSRLSFSTTIFCLKHRNPDILLIDEALEAGTDLNFRNKALNKMEEILLTGANVVLVSHDLVMIEKYCHDVIWLDKGKIVKQGPASEVVEAYVKVNE
ncbi:MAG: ATP-binding cassette domain-containing protein [Candidatus Paceibacterota bacterium]|jgi:ABC-type polysaccharide/polyol phosphate transport system ATPase subunit